MTLPGACSTRSTRWAASPIGWTRPEPSYPLTRSTPSARRTPPLPPPTPTPASTPQAATEAIPKQLILAGHRYYDPNAGRFISRDPIGQAGGLDQYQHCFNDPVNSSDTLDLFDWER